MRKFNYLCLAIFTVIPALLGCESREDKYLRLQSEKESLLAKAEELGMNMRQAINDELGPALWNLEELEPLRVKAKESFGDGDTPIDFIISEFSTGLSISEIISEFRTAELKIYSMEDRVTLATGSAITKFRNQWLEENGDPFDVLNVIKQWDEKIEPVVNKYEKEASAILIDQLSKRNVKENEITDRFESELEALDARFQEVQNTITALERT